MNTQNSNLPQLEQWLSEQPKDQFPENGSVDYSLQYQHISQHMINKVHSQVDVGAAITNRSLLTKHGPEHIKTVISRASKLAFPSDAECVLTPYEAYILLVAIHLHDVGNFSGRKRHEKKSTEVFLSLGPMAGDDTAEKRYITNIAEAHGGQFKGSKDTIGNLPEKSKILDFQIRIQFIAGILRLADEIAEDRTRASSFLLKNGVIPDENLVYHDYADRLYSLTSEEREINFIFHLNEEIASRKYDKDGSEVFLIDEIFHRTWKTFCECIYCMRFTRPDISINTINITIEICTKNYMRVKDTIKYQIIEAGYPETQFSQLFVQNPDLVNWNGLKGKLTGNNC